MTYRYIQARLDQIAQAIWLCANGQEHMYSRMQRQQAAINAKVKEWLARNADQFSQGFEDQPQRQHTNDTKDNVREDWRQLNTVPEIVRAFPRHPSTDDIIDLYQRNKNLNSSDLKALLEKHSR